MALKALVAIIKCHAAQLMVTLLHFWHLTTSSALCLVATCSSCHMTVICDIFYWFQAENPGK